VRKQKQTAFLYCASNFLNREFHELFFVTVGEFFLATESTVLPIRAAARANITRRVHRTRMNGAVHSVDRQ
jgi:hypothetical protein